MNDCCQDTMEKCCMKLNFKSFCPPMSLKVHAGRTADEAHCTPSLRLDAAPPSLSVFCWMFSVRHVSLFSIEQKPDKRLTK